MVKKLIIVQHRFGLTTPKTQRMLAAAKEYAKRGIEVHFIYSASKNESPEDLYSSISFKRIKEKGRLDIYCYRRFIKVIKSLYEDDTVILFYDIPYYAILFRYPKYNVFAEVTEVPLYGKRASFFKRILEHLTLVAARHFTGLFVISQPLKEYYQARGVNNIEIINMFVDKTRFEGLKKENIEKYVGYCGTISTHKDGVDDLIRAFSILNKKYPEYKLYLFGRFESDTVKEALKSEIEELKLSSKVLFTGAVDSSEMPQKLLDASILALSRPNNTQAQYGFPTKLGEYLSTGNPVLVTSVGDIPFFLKDGENAFLANPGNFNDFAKKLIWIEEHPEIASEVADAGKKLVDTVFSAEVQIKKALMFINNSIS